MKFAHALLIISGTFTLLECQSQRVLCPLPNQHCDCSIPDEVTCSNINSIPDQLPDMTTFLDVGNNFIGPVVIKDHVDQLQSLPLERLYMPNNNLEIIQDYAFQSLNLLLELDIGDNQIQVLTERTFEGLKSLIYLYAHDAGIVALSPRLFEPLTNLEYIDFEDNAIAFIDLEFTSLPNLKTLLLAENQISQISRGAFSGLNDLTHLSLFGNRLNKPMSSWFRTIVENDGKIELDRRMNSLTTDPNPWLCCPDIALYHNYIRGLDRNIKSFSQLDFECFWPVAISGRLVSTLSFSELDAVSCSEYTAKTTSTLFTTSTEGTTSGSVVKVFYGQTNFLNGLNDMGAFFILLLIAVIGGLIVGGLCYCCKSKRGKQRLCALADVFRPRSCYKEYKEEPKNSTELTTRPYRQNSPAYGSTTQAGADSTTIYQTSQVPSAEYESYTSTVKSYTETNDEEEIWSKSPKKKPL